MNVVLVGCGAMSKVWLDAAREVPGIAVVGLVDLDADRAKALAREYELNGVAIGTNLDALLDQTKPQAVFDDMHGFVGNLAAGDDMCLLCFGRMTD